MPPKAHRTGLPRTHSRSSSGGSSKALNLHFTQKDPTPTKQVEKTKKNGLIHDVRTLPRGKKNFLADLRRTVFSVTS
jgi:hypothetical protein